MMIASRVRKAYELENLELSWNDIVGDHELSLNLLYKHSTGQETLTLNNSLAY